MKRLLVIFLLPFLCAACRLASDVGPAAAYPSMTETISGFPNSSLIITPVISPSSPVPFLSKIQTPANYWSGKIYYVRPDGGTAAQCDGLEDTPYSEGASPECAWNHPFQALPPLGAPRIAGGDTLIISTGEYEMGYGAPGTENCDAESAYDCHMPPIPSGMDAKHPTRILGEGLSSGCGKPPQLWGSERADYILNLAGSSNVEVACLEVTDHSECIELQENGFPCERDAPPYGDWAATGLYAADSTNVHLIDMNIHGLADSGVHAGGLADWTLENVRIAANGWSGWDGDIGDDSSNSGTMLFRHWRVEWNGCGETYPGGRPTRCWAQSAGGYGDGVGTGATGGHWIIQDFGLPVQHFRRPRFALRAPARRIRGDRPDNRRGERRQPD